MTLHYDSFIFARYALRDCVVRTQIHLQKRIILNYFKYAKHFIQALFLQMCVCMRWSMYAFELMYVESNFLTIHLYRSLDIFRPHTRSVHTEVRFSLW